MWKVQFITHLYRLWKAVCQKTQHYIVTIVENQAIDLYRDNQRKSTVKYINDISGIAVEPGKTHGLDSCMAKLPARYREVILMKYHYVRARQKSPIRGQLK